MQISEPETLSLARAFLADVAPHSDYLFILGDFVEYWIGDDTEDGALSPVFDSIANLAGHGTQVFFMHGNRDFLIGEKLAARCKATLIRSDHHVFEKGGRRILLMHGDTLCTDDTGYQQMRTRFRDPDWQQAFLSKPVAERHAYAQSLRSQSKANQRNASDEKSATQAQHQAEISPLWMDVTDQAVVEVMTQFDVTELLHGHTHKPNRHTVNLDGKQATRWVVGDWGPSSAIYAKLEKESLKLLEFSPRTPL